MSRIVKWALLAMVALAVIGGVVVFGAMAFVFSIGTAVVPVEVDVSVLDRNTRAPIANCLLVFEKGGVNLGRPATIDYGQTTERTDAQGRLRHATSHSYVGSMFWPFDRERDPAFRFYLGEAPHLGSTEEVESWRVGLRFDEPWTSSTELVPVIEVQRSLAHEETRTRSGGFEPLPSEPADRLLRAVVRFGASEDGREAYLIPLSVFLDAQQIRACQAPTLDEGESRAVEHFNAGRYEEALAAYREVARRKPDSAWAHRGAANALDHLGRRRESTEAYRKALALAPQDAEILYWYANSMIGTMDKEAAAQFRKLIALEPTNARGFIGLANSLYELDRFRETVEAFDQAAKLCASCLDEHDRSIHTDAKRLLRGR